MTAPVQGCPTTDSSERQVYPPIPVIQVIYSGIKREGPDSGKLTVQRLYSGCIEFSGHCHHTLAYAMCITKLPFVEA